MDRSKGGGDCLVGVESERCVCRAGVGWDYLGCWSERVFASCRWCVSYFLWYSRGQLFLPTLSLTGSDPNDTPQVNMAGRMFLDRWNDCVVTREQ